MDQQGGQAPRRSTLAYEGLPGTVYLLHFACPSGANPSTRAQHYLGWTQNLRRRLNEHRKGRGSSVTRRAHREGVPFVLAQTWPGTTQREAELRLLAPRELCPVCQACRAHGSLRKGEFFGTYLAQLPDLRGSPHSWQGQARLDILASWLVTRCLGADGRAVFPSAQAVLAVFGTAPLRR